MASIFYSRSKVYESRGNDDEPVKHLESEGERLIKQMVQKQMNTHSDIKQELKREQNFKSVTDTLPLTEFISGLTTLKEFELTAEKTMHIEELKSLGLSNDEIQNLLNFEEDIVSEKDKKIDKSIHSAYLQSILEKVARAKKEHEISPQQSSSNSNRHLRELGLSVKPDCKYTKLLNFVMSCQKVKNDTRPINHPINNLKSIEEELFSHHKKRKKQIAYKPTKSPATKKSAPQYSYERGSSLWDVKPNEVKIPTARKITESYEHKYDCKQECFYTVTNGKIKSVYKGEHKIENNTTKNSDAYVLSNVKQSNITLMPLENIAKNRLSLQEIQSTPKFSKYMAGTPSKILYVKNLAGSVTNSDLVSLFGHFDRDPEIRVVYRLLTGRMRGQAFITFPSTSVAEEALKSVNGYVLKSQPIILQFGRGKSDVRDS